MEAPPGVAERQDEHVERDGTTAVVDPGLAPVDLALLARRRLEPYRRPLRRLLDVPQGPHEPLHRFIAAAERAAVRTCGARLCRYVVCAVSRRSPSSARLYGCPAVAWRIARTVLRSNPSCRAISAFARCSP